MNALKSITVALVLSFAASADMDTNSQCHYLFVYFLNAEEQVGARLALSADGIYWEKVNGGEPIFTPSIGNECMMRDPNICFDKQTGIFHLVWATGWNQKNIGYSRSHDLKNWRHQQCVPVGDKISNCLCCWSPEIIHDDIKDSFMVYWSTDTGNGKRAYYSMTKDFAEYTRPEILFDPGYPIIDATVFKAAAEKYYLFFKDERTPFEAGKQTKNIHYVTGPTPRGPWNMTGLCDNVSKPATNPGCEGPSIIQIGNEYRLYFDPYLTFSSTYRMVITTDITAAEVSWTQGPVLKTSNGDFLYSHGSISEIPRGKFMQLLYGVPDTTTYSSTIPEESDDEPFQGCGTGAGLALFPPLLFKAWMVRSRKRKNTAMIPGKKDR